ncbi:zinc finger protein 263-like [Ischnura elegans]|uniref:zinc finger protein 263-like n=1 Tax=Ischnura elegans TaxID=197161 RepID=UPI001ED870E6|nr:zinc finger protein 263-like [Ischnura elegans]
MSVDKFFLQMKSHSKQVFSVLRELYDSSSLTDVTLLCEGHYFGAHRLVLSACSPYFRTLFTTIPDKHPVIFMKGVKKTEMIDILDFMYNGEVTISHTQLASFLQIADELSVNGLTKGLQNEDGGEEPGNPEPSLDKYTVKRRRISCSDTTEDNKRKVPHANEETDEEPTQQELNEILPHLDLNNAGESIEVLIDKDSNPNLKIIPNHKDNGDLLLDNLEVSRDQQFNKSRIIETDIKEEIESPDNTSQMKKEVSRPCVPSVDVMLGREAVPPPKVPSNSDTRQEAPNVRLLSHWAVEPGDSGIPGVSLPTTRGMVPGGIPPFSGSSGGGPGCVSVSGSGSGTGAYQCPVCGKMCNAKHHLTYHLRTHTGERPYRCDVCGLTFSQQSNMYRHKRTKHVGVSGEGRGLVDGQGYAMVNIE